MIRYEHTLWRSMTFDTFVFLPLRTARVAELEGSSALDIRMLAIALSLSREIGPARLGGGVGIAGVWLHAEGDATPPLRSAVRNILAATPLACVSAVLGQQSALRARLDLCAGIAMPQPTVEFAGRQVAEWGAPWAAPALGVELRVP
jgi:hypothetical protein